MDRATDPPGTHCRPPETRPVWEHSGGAGGPVRSIHHVTLTLAPSPVRPPGRLRQVAGQAKIARAMRAFFCPAMRGKDERHDGQEAPRPQEGSETMNDVRLDRQQVPARAELLLAAELGKDAPGRPIYARLEPDDHDGEPSGRIKVGAVLTRRLHAAEATETPAGAAYGNPLRGRPEKAPSVRSGPPSSSDRRARRARLARLPRDATGTVMYDEWIDDDPANGGLALTRLRPAAGTKPEVALRRAVATRPGHAAARDVAEWLANVPTERPGPTTPRSRAARRGGAGTSRVGGAAHERERAAGKRRPGGARTARVARHRRAGRRGAARDPRGCERRAPGRHPPRCVRHGAAAGAREHRRLTPSVDDVALTERLKQAGTLMGIGPRVLLAPHGVQGDARRPRRDAG